MSCNKMYMIKSFFIIFFQIFFFYCLNEIIFKIIKLNIYLFKIKNLVINF